MELNTTQIILLIYMISTLMALIYVFTLYLDKRAENKKLKYELLLIKDDITFMKSRASCIQGILGEIYIPVRDRHRPSFSVDKQTIQEITHQLATLKRGFF